MSEKQKPFKDFVPKHGFLHQEDTTQYILCKPKLMPLKSVTLEKMEKMQKDAEVKLKQQQQEAEKLGSNF